MESTEVDSVEDPRIHNYLQAIGTCRALGTCASKATYVCVQRRLLSVLNESKQPSLCS